MKNELFYISAFSYISMQVKNSSKELKDKVKNHVTDLKTYLVDWTRGVLVLQHVFTGLLYEDSYCEGGSSSLAVFG